MNRLIISIWVRALMAGRRVVDWGRRLLADPPELHRRLMPFIIPVAVLLSQALIVVVVESLAVIVRSMQGEDIPSLVKALPVLLKAWAIPMGLAGTLLPLAFNGIRAVAAENGGFGFRAPRVRGIVADTIVGAAVGAGLWAFSAAAAAGLQAAGAPVPSQSTATADAGLNPVSIIIAVIAVPVVEELMFRGLVSRPLMRSSMLTREDGGRGLAACILMACLAGLPFGILHMDSASGPLWSVLSVAWMTVFGAVQTMLADRRGLLCPMIGHVAYNLIVVASTAIM